MNEQLPVASKLNIDLTTGVKLDRDVSADLGESSVDLMRAKGLMFAMALKARATGVRPIVEDTIFAAVEKAELKAGKALLEIRHRQQAADRGKPYYTSSLTNRSTERIRIDRFGTYIQKGKTLVLHSLTGGFLSAQQFREWYGVDGEWIEPGQTVTDTSSHSNLGVYWVYFGVTQSGKEVVAGAVWKGGGWF